MSKAKQILSILFPNGIWLSYIPDGANLLIQIFIAIYNISTWHSYLGLMISSICILFALKSIYNVHQDRVFMKSETEFMKPAFMAVESKIEALIDKKMPNGFDPVIAIEVINEVDRIIALEILRRKNHSPKSKPGKF